MMNPKMLMLSGMFVLLIAFSGCHTAGYGQPNQPLGQVFNPTAGGLGGLFQQPILNGANNQQAGGLSIPQVQQGVGGFVQDLGNRFSNGLINQGINRVANGLFSGL